MEKDKIVPIIEIGGEASDGYFPQNNTGEFEVKSRQLDEYEVLVDSIKELPEVMQLAVIKDILGNMDAPIWNIVLNYLFDLFKSLDHTAIKGMVGENEKFYEQAKLWIESIENHADRIEATRRLIRDGVLLIDEDLAKEILDKVKSRFSVFL